MKPHTGVRAYLTVIILGIVGCGGGGGGSSSPPSTLIGEVVVSGLSFPTALRFTPNGDIIVIEKGTGDVKRVVGGVVQPGPIFNVSVDSTGERGLLGLALDPNYAVNKFVYLFYTKSNGTENEVLRFTDGAGGPNPTVIVPSLPAANNHDGGRIEFGPDGKLYVTLGENGDPANSQTDAVPTGKVLRYNSDGTIPLDNPISGNPLFSKGHRNCFGLAIDQNSGVVFVSENGPNCDDEVNRCVANGNYGWRPGQPCNDNDANFLAPIFRFSTVIAPTGITVGSGAYSDTLLMSSLNDRKLRMIQFSNFPNGSVSSASVVYTSPVDAIIDVTMGPDGNPYIAVTDFGADGKILRLVP